MHFSFGNCIKSIFLIKFLFDFINYFCGVRFPHACACNIHTYSCMYVYMHTYIYAWKYFVVALNYACAHNQTCKFFVYICEPFEFTYFAKSRSLLNPKDILVEAFRIRAEKKNIWMKEKINMKKKTKKRERKRKYFTFRKYRKSFYPFFFLFPTK